MRAEEYLQSAREMYFRIMQLERERADVLENMAAIRSTTEYTERVQSSPKQDGLEMQVIRAIEKMDRINDEIVKKREMLVLRRHDIREKICEMKEGQCRRFLIDYYIECRSIRRIIEEYGYTDITAPYQLRKRAIREFERIRNKS